MSLKKMSKSQAGSALIQAMMGLGLVGMISYAVMNYQHFSNIENRTQFAQNDLDSTAQIVSALLAVPALCNSNLQLQNAFPLPGSAQDTAPNFQVAIDLGLATTAQPAWVNGIMGGATNTSIPGSIDVFNVQVDQLMVTGARFKQATSPTTQVWVGELIMSAQKPNNFGTPATTGRRVIGQLELEVTTAGAKVRCSTNVSPATVCRDLGGVYDQNGSPRCLFAMSPMNCSSSGVDGYIHDIDANGNPVCASATASCPAGYFANGITNGDLNCTKLSRKIVYAAAPPTPPPSTATVLCYLQDVRCNVGGVIETFGTGPWPPSDPTCGGRTLPGSSPGGTGCSWLGGCRQVTTDSPANAQAQCAGVPSSPPPPPASTGITCQPGDRAICRSVGGMGRPTITHVSCDLSTPESGLYHSGNSTCSRAGPMGGYDEICRICLSLPPATTCVESPTGPNPGTWVHVDAHPTSPTRVPGAMNQLGFMMTWMPIDPYPPWQAVISRPCGNRGDYCWAMKAGSGLGLGSSDTYHTLVCR